MDRRVILARLDAERRNLAHDGEVVDVRPLVTRLRAADNTHHTISYSALDARSDDAAIATEIAHHRKLGVPFEWKLYAHDRPRDIADRLRRHGFTIGRKEAVLVLDLESPPAWVTSVADGIVVRRGDDEEVIADHRQVAESVFGKDFAFTTGQLLDALREGSTQHRCYVAYASTGRPVSIGRLYTHPDSAFGGLYGGGTLDTHRGRGFYRATVAARARDAIALGAPYLVVDARPTSRPILESLGFQHLTDTWPCTWRP
jgi:hypothetical protein